MSDLMDTLPMPLSDSSLMRATVGSRLRRFGLSILSLVLTALIVAGVFTLLAHWAKPA